MSKTLFLTSTLTDEVIDGQSVIALKLTQGDIRDLCLCLCLLRESLVAEVLLRSPNNLGICVEQKVDYKENRLVRNPSFTTLQLTRIELERLVHFFLQYYRDGAAEVDHLDIEANENAANQMRTSHLRYRNIYRQSLQRKQDVDLVSSSRIGRKTLTAKTNACGR